MKATINTLANEIMSNTDTAIMLFAPAGSGKANFLSELSNRYRTVFWFNVLTDDVTSPALAFAEKVLKDDLPMLNKIQQLAYCESDYDNQMITIMAILEYIEQIKWEVLIVFERLESLPNNFDLSILERIIKNAPKNAKIVCSSDKFINFDFSRFEPKYPKLVDESFLQDTHNFNFDNYLADLSPEDKNFLAYASEFNYIDKNFADFLYPKGVEILEMLSRKDHHICARGNYYAFNSLLKFPLEEFLVDDENSFLKTYSDFLYKNGQFFHAFKLFLTLNNLEMVDKCVKEIIKDKINFLKARNFLDYNDLSKLNYGKDYKYLAIIVGLSYLEKKQFHLTREMFASLASYFKNNDERAFIVCSYYLIKSHYYLSEYTQALDLVTKIRENFEEKHIFDIEEILSFIPTLFRELDINVSVSKIEDYEKLINLPENQYLIFYASAMQAIASAYFDNGNYIKAMRVADTLKDIIPFYSIPHNLIYFYYYSGDINTAAYVANNSLNFAIKQEITEDISLIYSSLASCDLYKGLITEGLSKFDIAVGLDRENNYTKFFNISLRCMAYARYGDSNYAKELALINFRYANIFSPQYKNMLECALAYCYWRLKDYDKAHSLATACIKNSKSRSVFWLMGMAMATSYLLGKSDLKDAKTLIKNIIKSSHKYGMDIILVDNYDIFEGIFQYAIDNDIETDYLDKIYKLIADKNTRADEENIIDISMFGDSVIKVNGKEIQWKTKKSRELFLHYVVAHKNGIDRGIILENLWKDYLYVSAINNLKTTNNLIRKTLKKYNLDFSLDYVNSKYQLKLNNLNCDYFHFLELCTKFSNETNINLLMEYMSEMMKLYKGEFAEEIIYPYFENQRDKIRQEFAIRLLKMVRLLTRDNKLFEAKEYLSRLISIDKNTDYSSMKKELDDQIRYL